MISIPSMMIILLRNRLVSEVSYYPALKDNEAITSNYHKVEK